MADKFDDIEAYQERDFLKYYKRLTSDDDFKTALKGIGGSIQNTSKAPQKFSVAEFKLSAQKKLGEWGNNLGRIKDSLGFRNLMIQAIGGLTRRTFTGLSVSGLDKAMYQKRERGICFLSNHRSTSLDPILVNYFLAKTFNNTAYNAAGDNIFTIPWLSHLIRLNRGFIVKRNVEDFDQKLIEAERLSNYIQKLLKQKEWVWIAHRNGRAKDGNDKTDSAVLAMLKKSNPDQSWGDFCGEQDIVPISLSYELIPLDLEMAQELGGSDPHAGEHRDMRNIITELGQKKGHLHVSFGNPINESTRNEITKSIDSGILRQTKLFESNLLAAKYLGIIDGEGEALLGRTGIDLEQGRWIIERGDSLTEADRSHFMQMYAAPVKNLLDELGTVEGLVPFIHKRTED